MQRSLHSFFGGKQSTDDKETNTSETPAPTKKNTQIPGVVEGEIHMAEV